jgi:hypothetical protein
MVITQTTVVSKSEDSPVSLRRPEWEVIQEREHEEKGNKFGEIDWTSDIQETTRLLHEVIREYRVKV